MNMDKKGVKQPVDFDECLKDSPRFRLQIDQSEHDINTLEGLLEKIIKQCNAMVDSGKAFNSSTSVLLSGIDSLAKYFDGDKLVQDSLKKFCCVLGELKNYFKTLLEQTKRSISITLHHFVKDDIKKVKDTKKLFDKISDDLDNALNKHAQLPKTSKPQEIEEDKNILTAMQSCFHHISLDYAFQINILQSRKRIEVLDTLSKFMHSHFTYYHQGYDLMNDLDAYMKDVSSELDGLSIRFTVDKKEMEERHTLVQRKDEAEKSVKDSDDSDDIVIEGYLCKRSSNAFKSWHRRYFTMQNNQLFYQKRLKDEQTVLAEDLRLCIVKLNDEIERRFCFDVVSPTKTWCLQADSESIRDEWIITMQASINKAFSAPAPESDSEEESLRPFKRSKSLDSLDKVAQPPSILSALRSVPGNEICADCGHTDPKWASINLGVVLCIECSGIHRSLGVHVSKVRSLTLDAWEPEHLKLMSELGNSLINTIYEAKVDASIKKVNHLSSRSERETWIKAKYLHHKYVSLDIFLRTSDNLDGGIIRNLARMKVYHEQKNSKADDNVNYPSIERSDSRVTKILKMTHGLKRPFKGDKKKKHSSAEGLSVNDHKGKVDSDSQMEKNLKSRIRTFSKGKKDGDLLKRNRKHSKGSLGTVTADKLDGDSISGNDQVNKINTKGRLDAGSSLENLFLKEDSGMSSTGGLVNESPGKEHRTVELAHSSSGSPSGSVSSGIDIKAVVKFEGSEVDEDEGEEDSPRTWASKVFAEHSLDSDEPRSGTQSRSRSESTDSVLSDEGVAIGVTSDASSSHLQEGDTENAFQEDLEKAISVLKILHPNRLLYKAAEWKSIPLMVAAFAEGAKVNWVNEDDDFKTVLHQSVLGGSLTASEYLLQNGAKVNIRDHRGRGALHHAALLGQTGQTCLFLKRGANQHAVDESGEDPLSIALKQTNADIVTLLRIARLNDEMRESEEFSYGSPGDVTFTDVFRDFSNMASMNPDRLKRDFGGNSKARDSKDDPNRQTSL